MNRLTHLSILGLGLLGALHLGAVAEANASSVGASAAAVQEDQPFIRSYKRDPMPIYDGDSALLRRVAMDEMPAPGPDLLIRASMAGYVSIRMDGEVVWLRSAHIVGAGDFEMVSCEVYASIGPQGTQNIDQGLGEDCPQ